MKPVRNQLLICCIGLLFISCMNGQGNQQVTERDYLRAEQFLWSNAEELVYRADIDLHWIDKDSLFWYKVDTRRGNEFFIVNTNSGSKKKMFDHQKLSQKLSATFDEQLNPYQLSLKELEWDYLENTITFKHDTLFWQVDLETYEINRVKAERNNIDKCLNKQCSYSPNGNWIVTRKSSNLWLTNNETGEEYQLTDDASENEIYGASLPGSWQKKEGPIEEEREMLGLNVSWSKDSQKIFAHKLDIRNQKSLYLLQHVPDAGFRAQSISYYRSLPGEDSVAQQIPYVFDIDNKSQTRIEAGPYDEMIAGDWTWYEDSETLHMILRERGYGSASLLRADAESGEVDTVFKEVSDTYVDPGKSEAKYLPTTDEFLWLSERDGWNHIYLYDLMSGDVKQQVTNGEFVVYNIEHVDKQNRKIFFTAGGREPDRDPYLEHLYSVNFDGTNLNLLTPENANHEINFSPNQAYFVDTYSRADLKPKTVLRRSSDGSVVSELETADIKDLLDTSWQKPEPFKIKARDGETDIYGLIFRPTNFDPSKKYPIIDGSYSGPQAVRTPKTFKGAYRGEQFRGGYTGSEQPLAELGFIVITVDGLGTAGRSKTFQDYSWKNLGDNGSADHIKAIKELAEQYSYMDTSRVGIYGHSAGGYDAARAILKYPDFYKVAVSSGGNHDHRIAKAWWPELYMGYPVGSHYEDQSNFKIAQNLEGHLLIAHGDMDNNVHPAETVRLADAFINAGKNFDMLVMANEAHWINTTDYFKVKRWNYFVQHLLGEEPVWHYSSKMQ